MTSACKRGRSPRLHLFARLVNAQKGGDTATATRSPSVPSAIAHVFGITCSTPECGYHESLHTVDPVAAVRTARELGWDLSGNETVCPLCVAATEPTNGNKRRRAGGVR
jgi:hypothetical protein